MVDIGTAIIAEWVEPAVELEPAYTNPDGEVIAAVLSAPRLHPEEVLEDVTLGEATTRGASWTKTGVRIVPQGIDASKMVADLTAALQELTLLVISQQRRIEALESGI